MPRSRRAILQTGAGVTVAGLAGCSGFGGTNATVDVDLRNEHDATHELAVTITFDDERLFDRAEELAPDEIGGGSFRNPNSTGSAQVEATLDDESPTTKAVRVGPGTGIRYVAVPIGEDGNVRISAART